MTTSDTAKRIAKCERELASRKETAAKTARERKISELVIAYDDVPEEVRAACVIEQPAPRIAKQALQMARNVMPEARATESLRARMGLAPVVDTVVRDGKHQCFPTRISKDAARAILAKNGATEC